MSIEKKKASLGLGLLVTFTAILVLIFMPILNGKNSLEYLDDLYNSISKGSAYYVPAMRKQAAAFADRPVDVTINMGDEEQAGQTALLYQKAGANAIASGAAVMIGGDLGGILANCLDDADAMYHNDAGKINSKYGYDERQVLYNWWESLNEIDKQLSQQKMFKEAKVVELIKKKAVETSYNYYGVQPQKIADELGVVVFSLVFYVIYTLWYGFAIMYLFEGLGLRLSH